MRQELVSKLQAGSRTAEDVDPAIDAVFDAAAETGISCIRCGYLLKGLDQRRPCPECGLLSGLSYLDATELRNNLPRWLRGLSIGAALTGLGLLLVPWLPTAATLMYTSVRWRILTGNQVDWSSWVLGLALGALMSTPVTIGIWLLTNPARRPRHDAESRRVRLSLRALALVPVLLVIFWALAAADLLASGLADWPDAVVAMIVLLIWGAITVIVLFRYLRWLAARAPAPLLAADSPIVGTVLGVCLLTPFLIAIPAIAGSDLDPNKPLGTIIWIIYVVIAAVGITAYLWSIYLLIRYWIAFSRTARDARELMRQSDAAAGTLDMSREAHDR